MSYLTAARGKLSIGRVITLMSAGFNLGSVMGPIIGGRIGDQFGLRQSYFAAGVLFLFSLMVIIFISPQPVEKSNPNQEGSRWYLSSRYLVYMGVMFFAFFAMYLPQPLSPNYLSNQGGYDLSQIGILYSVSSVGVVVFNLVLGSLPALNGFLIGQSAMAFFSLILWWGSGYAWYVVGFFMLGGFRTARNLGVAQVRQLVPSAKMGLAYGVTETVMGTAIILAPILAGVLYSQNPIMMYSIGTVLIVISVFLSGRFSPKPGDHDRLPVSHSPTAQPGGSDD